MATFLVDYSEGDPMVVVAESFGAAVDKFVGKIVDDDVLDMMANLEARAGTTALEREDVTSWISRVDKLSDEDPLT